MIKKESITKKGMNNYHLIPYPRKIKENTGFFCGNIGDSVAAYLDGGSEKIRFAPDSSFGQDKYRLDITGNGAVITAGSEKAKLYGAVTLGQLVRQFGKEIPCVTIEDSPLVPIRMVQVCLGQVNAEIRRDWFVHFIQRMAELKITHIGLYLEWNFCFPSVPQLNNPHYPNKEDMLFVQAEAKKFGIEIVPEFAFMGHSKDLLELEAFADIREFDRKCTCETEMTFDSLCLTHPKTRALIETAVNDICDIFTSELIHIGGDEVSHIGECITCRKRKNEVGTMGLYLDYIEFVSGLLAKRGKKTGVWGDMLLMLTDNSPFWEGKDLEPAHRAAAIERLCKLKKRIVIFDWWYVGVNKESIDFFRGLGLQVVACTSTNGCYVSAVNLGQLQNAQLLCEYALQAGCEGVMMCDWINYLGDHAEQQYVFYAAAACLGWSGANAHCVPGTDGFFDALGVNLYNTDGAKLKAFWNYEGNFNSELLSFYPEKERGLALRKYVFQTDNPLEFYERMKYRFDGETIEKYGTAIKKLKKYAADLGETFHRGKYASFVLLSVLLHETLYKSFVAIAKAEKEYSSAAEKQYTDFNAFYAELDSCVQKLEALDAIYAEAAEYVQSEYALLGNDGPARIRMEALRKNTEKLVSFVQSLKDGHRPLPSFKNIAENLFAAQRCSEWNAREIDWADEKTPYTSFCVDNGKSWFCRPFDCMENH